ESNDVFADQVQVGWPHAALFVLRPANSAQVSGERVKPHVKHVRLFAWHRNAPANRGARNAQILQSAFNETDDFVLARFWLDELRVFPVKVEQWLLKSGELEKIVFFGNSLGGPAAVRAVVSRLRVVHKRVVVNAVLARVMAFVDVAVFLAQLE